MEYELVKQLKDAGYPFPTIESIFGSWLWEVDDEPALSELIAECGPHVVLHSPGSVEVGEWHHVPSETEWTAFKQYFMKTDNVSPHQVQGRGTTPKEAFANLWLALNKK